MGETITPRRFHEVDWRVVRGDASTHFRTGSFAAGVALVDAIGRLAEAVDHPRRRPSVGRRDGLTPRATRSTSPVGRTATERQSRDSPPRCGLGRLRLPDVGARP
jgi:hypothetical protein